MMTILLRAFYHNISKVEPYCAGPENIHTPPPPPSPLQKRLKISCGGRGSLSPKHLKRCMKLNWNFQRGGGLGKNPLHGGRYEYFLELHIFNLFTYGKNTVFNNILKRTKDGLDRRILK